MQLCRFDILSSYAFLDGLFFFRLLVLGGTDAEVAGSDDCLLHLWSAVLNKAAEQVDLVVLFGRFWGDVLEEEQLGLAHFVATDLFVVIILAALGELGVFLFDFIDFRDIDEGDVFLTVDLLKL